MNFAFYDQKKARLHNRNGPSHTGENYSPPLTTFSIFSTDKCLTSLPSTR